MYLRFLSFEDDQETLDKFHLHLFPEVGIEKEKHVWLPKIRKSLWNILDFQDEKLLTKVGENSKNLLISLSACDCISLIYCILSQLVTGCVISILSCPTYFSNEKFEHIYYF